MLKTKGINLRALERHDLKFIHNLTNDNRIMSYWFEEPFESYAELEDLYKKHLHDIFERRFIIENTQNESVGLSELTEIDYIHRSCEFCIIIDPIYQKNGYATKGTYLTIKYAFELLNLRKVYLLVSVSNIQAIKLYTKVGFLKEAELIEEFFVNGIYCNVIRMYMLQDNYYKKN
jgi:diamine N-acetyltransferase